MKIKINDLIVEVWFTHTFQCKTGVKAKTTCKVLCNWIQDTPFEESAQCVVEDNFDKEKGRKLALTRALARINELGREERTIIWKTYLGRRKTNLVKDLSDTEFLSVFSAGFNFDMAKKGFTIERDGEGITNLTAPKKKVYATLVHVYLLGEASHFQFRTDGKIFNQLRAFNQLKKLGVKC